MKFKELRKQANLSVDEVAQKLGRKKETIYKYESSFRLPSFHILSQMSVIYKIDLETLLKTYRLHEKEYKEKENKNGRNLKQLN